MKGNSITHVLTPAQMLEACERYSKGESTCQIAKSYGVTPHAILNNLRRRHLPIRNSNRINPQEKGHVEIKESPDFAYFLGVLLGDSCILKTKIIFSMKDSEFRAKVAEIGKKIIGREPGHWQGLCFYSSEFIREFQSWLNFHETSLTLAFGGRSHNSDPRAFIKIYEFVQKSRENAKAFIEGFYDSEGSLYQSMETYLKKSGEKVQYIWHRIEISNTNKDLLQFVQTLLLDFFKIESKVCFQNPKGFERVRSDGRVVKSSKDSWRLRIGKQDTVKQFARSIHSSIPRKNLQT